MSRDRVGFMKVRITRTYSKNVPNSVANAAGRIGGPAAASGSGGRGAAAYNTDAADLLPQIATFDQKSKGVPFDCF